MSPDNDVDQLLSRITAEFDDLPRQLQRVARYVEQQRANIMVQRINDIAVGCGVHPSSVVRFAQQLGFSGYSEMQSVFRDAYTEQATPTRSYQQRIQKVVYSGRERMSSAQMALKFISASRAGLDELAKELDSTRLQAAVDILIQADNIYVAAVRRSFSVAHYVTYALRHTEKRVHLIDGLGGMYKEQVKSINKGDALIAISFPPYGQETLHCTQVARESGAKVVAVTESELGPLARNATVLLKVYEGSAFAFRALTSTVCLCQALFIALAYELELNAEKKQRGVPND